jgi:hypothetical protein
VLSDCPDKVWVGTVEFRIHLVPSSHDKLDGGETEGITEMSPPQIHVSKDLSLSAFMETLYHELTHAVDFVSDIEDGTDEESIADKHAKTWSQLWINNPRFQRWWAKACVTVRKDRQGKR